jgi:hypothetical protein
VIDRRGRGELRRTRREKLRVDGTSDSQVASTLTRRDEFDALLRHVDAVGRITAHPIESVTVDRRIGTKDVPKVHEDDRDNLRVGVHLDAQLELRVVEDIARESLVRRSDGGDVGRGEDLDVVASLEGRVRDVVVRVRSCESVRSAPFEC